MASSILVLFLLPWLDTSQVRSARFRPVFQPFFSVVGRWRDPGAFGLPRSFAALQASHALTQFLYRAGHLVARG
jgi:hypothetical protein